MSEFKFPNNINKYPGSIHELTGRYQFFYKDNSMKMRTEFSFTPETKEAAKEECIKFRRKWGEITGNICNKYKDIGNGALEIDLGNGVFSIVDADDLEIVELYVWSVSTHGEKKYMTATVDCDKSGDKKGRRAYHQVLTEFKTVKFKNGNTLDNRKENMIGIPPEEVQRVAANEDCISHLTTKHGKYWELSGYMMNGKKINRRFSIDQFGDEIALKLALSTRDNAKLKSQLTPKLIKSSNDDTN